MPFLTVMRQHPSCGGVVLLPHTATRRHRGKKMSVGNQILSMRRNERYDRGLPNHKQGIHFAALSTAGTVFGNNGSRNSATWSGSAWKAGMSATTLLTGESVSTTDVMQSETGAQQPSSASVTLTISVLPEWLQCTSTMPEPIHTMRSDSRNEIAILAPFFIAGAKLARKSVPYMGCAQQLIIFKHAINALRCRVCNSRMRADLQP